MAIQPLRFSLQTSFPYKVFALTVGLLYLQMALNVDQANYMREKEKLSLCTFISDVKNDWSA